MMILLLITIVLVSIGIFITKKQADELKESMIQNAKNDARNFGFRSARAILDNDDLAISDNLQSMRNMPGYVLGHVLNPKTKVATVEFINKSYSDEKAYIEKTINQVTESIWTNLSKSNEPHLDQLDYQKRDVKLFVIYYPIYHPFIKQDPPLLGVVQIVLSNEVISERIKKNARQLIITTIGFWFLGGFGSFFLSRLIVRPIRVLVDGAKIIGEGNLDFKVPVLTNDELGDLAKQFNTMTEGLKNAQQEKEEQLLVNEQIRQAKEIQEGMNPLNMLDKNEYQVMGYTRAAKGVGGDYFDFQVLPNEKLALLISDVSGKSISASLVMVLIKTVVVTYIELFHKIRCDEILTAINKIMAKQAHIDKFATMMFTIFDPETKTVQFANGGQGPLFIYRAQDHVCTLSKQTGLPLGIDEDNIYHNSQLQLATGDMVVLYTDGVSEAWDKEKNEFGVHRLREKVIEYAPLRVDEIVKKIVVDIDNFSFGTEQHDDMTLVILKVK
ncbi:MAG: SpoIIE family protein phosphatase [Spirochaetia bacterium]|nr:SpoIIE family protein phosphatase [Spirochaetia bacterium]